MPFDFKAYDAKCAGLSAEELQKQWNHYTRLISGGATSTAISGLAIPLTAGVSSIGVALAAPGIHNARKKREIIERHLQRHGTTHETRKRDVLGSMAFSGTVGVVTLGAGSMGAESIMTNGAEHGMVLCETGVKVATHVVGDAVGMGVEHLHTDHKKKKDMRKLFEQSGTFQAVADAKAAEAGYSIGEGQGGGQYYGNVAGPSGAGSAVGSVAIVGSTMLPPPPPLYAPHDPLQPVPPPPSYGQQYTMTTGDSKAPMVYSVTAQGQQQQQQPVSITQQPYDPYAQYYQQTEASVASGVVMMSTGGSQVVVQEQCVQQQQYQSQIQGMVLVWDDEKGQYQQAVTPLGQVTREQGTSQAVGGSSSQAFHAQRSSSSGVFEMAALEQALPSFTTSTTTTQVSQNPTGPTNSISTVNTTVIADPQGSHATPTRSSTLVSQYSSTYSVEPGYCPTPRQSVSYPYPPPPPPQSTTAATPSPSPHDNSQQPTTVYQPTLQYASAQAPVLATHTPLSPAQPQFTVPNYNPSTQVPPQHTQYVQMPSAPGPIPQHQPYSQDSQTEKQQRPASALYFAPPPEQPKSKRMSIMHSVSSMMDQVKASQGAQQSSGNAQLHQDTRTDSPIATHNPITSQAEAALVRPQATPVQQHYQVPEPQYAQSIQCQHQPPYQQLEITMHNSSHMPPTPQSPPITSAASGTGTISAQHTGSQYQTYRTYQPQQQQRQTMTGGYFPPPPPGGPPPSSQRSQQYLPQKAVEPSSHGYNHGYAQQVQGGMLTPMATPGSSSGPAVYQGQAQPQYH